MASHCRQRECWGSEVQEAISTTDIKCEMPSNSLLHGGMTTSIHIYCYYHLIHKVKWRHISVVAMWSSFCRSTSRTVCS